MLESLPELVVTPALIAGALYLLSWILAVQIPAWVALWLSPVETPLARRILTFRAWRFLARLIALAFTGGFLYLALSQGFIDPIDIGLTPIDWQSLAPWLPTVAGAAAFWAALLWGRYIQKAAHDEDHSPSAAYGTILGVPAHILGEEMRASILRGALIPTLGLYWGAWAAVIAKGAIPWANPAVRRRQRQHPGRAFLYLDYGMDWLATGCFVVSGSLWASLIARAAGHLAVNLTYHALGAWGKYRARRTSTQHEKVVLD